MEKGQLPDFSIGEVLRMRKKGALPVSVGSWSVSIKRGNKGNQTLSIINEGAELDSKLPH